LKEQGKTFLLGYITQFGLLYNLPQSRTVITILCKNDLKDSIQFTEYTGQCWSLLKSLMSRTGP